MTPRSVGLLCLVLAACSSSAPGPSAVGSPGGDSESFQVDFSSRALEEGSPAVPDTVVRAGPGEVEVQGAIETSFTCADLSADVGLRDRSLTFQVVARAAEGCSNPAEIYGYDGRVDRLDAGTYDVHLLHVLAGQRRDTVLVQTVQVR